MSVYGESTTSEGFHSQLDELRAKIDLLPEGQRPEFRSLFDGLQRQHQRWRADCAESQRSAVEPLPDMIDELRLIARCVEFELDVSQADFVEDYSLGGFDW